MKRQLLENHFICCSHTLAYMLPINQRPNNLIEFELNLSCKQILRPRVNFDKSNKLLSEKQHTLRPIHTMRSALRNSCQIQ